MSGSNPFDAVVNLIAQLEEQTKQQENIIADLQAELAEARQEIERLRAEVAALAPADY